MNCPVCGAENESSAAYCYRCGSELRPGAAAATGQTVDLSRSAPGPSARPAAPASERSQSYADSPAMPPGPFGSPARDEGGARIYQTPDAGARPPYVVGPSVASSQTSNLAVISLILGIVSWIFLPLIGAIGAVITGHMGRREVRESGGRLSGEGLATFGMILGYVNLALGALFLVGICGMLMLAAGASVR